jgi:hypothetical protein
MTEWIPQATKAQKVAHTTMAKKILVRLKRRIFMLVDGIVSKHEV